MTPLVDVAFLLLTFFMFTTSMSRPQTMEINLPPDKKVKVEIAESNLLTLRVNDKGTIFWNIGHGGAAEHRVRTHLRTFLLGEGQFESEAHGAPENRPGREIRQRWST